MHRPWRLAALVLAVLAVVVVVSTVEVPSAVELRERAAGLGSWAPVAFLAAHALVTTTPMPRTAFTLSAGVLFGPWLGLALSLLASLVSAALAFAATRAVGDRALGGRAVQRLGPGRMRALEHRLSRRGLLTVVSTRMVPAIPFALLNYTLAVTTVRWRHYLLGTAVGMVPGTTAIVVLGDAAAGAASPASLVVFVVSGTLGVLGVLWSARRMPAPSG